MTPPVLNNDKRLFKLGGVIHLVDPIGIEPMTLRMRTVRSPECDTIRALFWGAKRQNFDGKRVCVPCGIDGGMRTIGREPPNDSHLAIAVGRDCLLDSLLNIFYRGQLLTKFLR